MPRRLDPDSRALPRSDGGTLHFATSLAYEGMKSRPTQDEFLLTASHILKSPHNYNPVHAHNTRYKRWYSSTFTEPKRQGFEIGSWCNVTILTIVCMLCFGLAVICLVGSEGYSMVISPMIFISSDYHSLQDLHSAVQNLQKEQKFINQEIESFLRYKNYIENTSQRLSSLLTQIDIANLETDSAINQMTVFDKKVDNFSTSVLTEVEDVMNELRSQIGINETENTENLDSLQREISELSKILTLYHDRKATVESTFDARSNLINGVSENIDLNHIQQSLRETIETFARNASGLRFFDEVKNDVILQSVKEISKREQILIQKTMDAMSYDKLIPKESAFEALRHLYRNQIAGVDWMLSVNGAEVLDHSPSFDTCSGDRHWSTLVDEKLNDFYFSKLIALH